MSKPIRQCYDMTEEEFVADPHQRGCHALYRALTRFEITEEVATRLIGYFSVEFHEITDEEMRSLYAYFNQPGKQEWAQARASEFLPLFETPNEGSDT